MGDFKKKADPPATDDTSPVPALGMANFNVAPDVDTDTDQAADDAETQRTAAPYWHPAWSKVQEELEAEIAAYNQEGGAIVHQALPADEFKIRMIVDALYVERIKKLMEDVKSAVEQVESRPKRGQSNAGGK